MSETRNHPNELGAYLRRVGAPGRVVPPATREAGRPTAALSGPSPLDELRQHRGEEQAAEAARREAVRTNAANQKREAREARQAERIAPVPPPHDRDQERRDRQARVMDAHIAALSGVDFSTREPLQTGGTATSGAGERRSTSLPDPSFVQLQREFLDTPQAELQARASAGDSDAQFILDLRAVTRSIITTGVVPDVLPSDITLEEILPLLETNTPGEPRPGLEGDYQTLREIIARRAATRTTPRSATPPPAPPPAAPGEPTTVRVAREVGYPGAGAVIGGTIGSLIPGPGTAVGTVVGAMAGEYFARRAQDGRTQQGPQITTDAPPPPVAPPSREQVTIQSTIPPVELPKVHQKNLSEGWAVTYYRREQRRKGREVMIPAGYLNPAEIEQHLGHAPQPWEAGLLQTGLSLNDILVLNEMQYQRRGAGLQAFDQQYWSPLTHYTQTQGGAPRAIDDFMRRFGGNWTYDQFLDQATQRTGTPRFPVPSPQPGTTPTSSERGLRILHRGDPSRATDPNPPAFLTSPTQPQTTPTPAELTVTPVVPPTPREAEVVTRTPPPGPGPIRGFFERVPVLGPRLRAQREGQTAGDSASTTPAPTSVDATVQGPPLPFTTRDRGTQPGDEEFRPSTRSVVGPADADALTAGLVASSGPTVPLHEVVPTPLPESDAPQSGFPTAPVPPGTYGSGEARVATGPVRWTPQGAAPARTETAGDQSEVEAAASTPTADEIASLYADPDALDAANPDSLAARQARALLALADDNAPVIEADLPTDPEVYDRALESLHESDGRGIRPGQELRVDRLQRRLDDILTQQAIQEL